MPKVVVIAGPNGAGKSTTAPAVLRDALKIQEFVNADTIAAGLSAFSPETVALHAGRVMLQRVRELTHNRRDFAFETTLDTCRQTATDVTSYICGFLPLNLQWLGSPSVFDVEGARFPRRCAKALRPEPRQPSSTSTVGLPTLG
jgi:predicted ABC-type ATPase